MISTETRTENARAALDNYRRGQEADCELQFAIVDLIADLLHVAAQENLSPLEVVQKAELHCRAEIIKLDLAAEP